MSDGEMMTIEGFEIAMARWGADPATWPDDARASAEALLSASAEARGLQADLIAMEADFAFAQDAPPSSDLMARVLSDAAAVAATQSAKPVAATANKPRWSLLDRLDGLSPFWRAAGTCAASALVGVFVGYASPAPIAEAATSMASLELLSGAVEEDADDSFELALNDLEPF